MPYIPDMLPAVPNQSDKLRFPFLYGKRKTEFFREYAAGGRRDGRRDGRREKGRRSQMSMSARAYITGTVARDITVLMQTRMTLYS
jgi:hypothetical protein